MKSNEQCCENCRFRRDDECHKKSPRAIHDSAYGGEDFTLWPSIHLDWWCGEWQAANDSPAQVGNSEERIRILNLVQGRCADLLKLWNAIPPESATHVQTQEHLARVQELDWCIEPISPEVSDETQ